MGGKNTRVWMVGGDLKLYPRHTTPVVTTKNVHIVKHPLKDTIPLD